MGILLSEASACFGQTRLCTWGDSANLRRFHRPLGSSIAGAPPPNLAAKTRGTTRAYGDILEMVVALAVYYNCDSIDVGRREAGCASVHLDQRRHPATHRTLTIKPLFTDDDTRQADRNVWH